MFLFVITIFLFTLYASLILFYRQGWLQLKTAELPPVNSVKIQTTVTVIIAARNEERNIGECLHSVIEQTYPRNLFTVIVVDDFSTDNTASIIRSFSQHNVSLISLKKYIGEQSINSYKKKALEIAIEKATGELIVITDADCLVPPSWLSTINAFYQKYHPVFIAAPVAYYGENNFLTTFQSLDFMTLQGITAASVHKRFHCMCNGANLAYTKKAFQEVGGFSGIDGIASGDDMLLMHKMYERYPTKVLFLQSAFAIVKTKPMETLREFFNQRIRWASKADKYQDKRIVLALVLVYFFNVYILLLGVLAFFATGAVFLFIGLLLAKIIVEILFVFPVAAFFNKTGMLWWFPVAQPFHIVYTIIAGWLGKFGSYKWKQRNVR